ncbi:unnamed protein product, partial [Prorocentrum cordatum]
MLRLGEGGIQSYLHIHRFPLVQPLIFRAVLRCPVLPEELESRFRNRIREQKLENARIVKANVPSVGGAVVDPIQRHVGRRLLRQRVKIQAGLEDDALHRNSAQILYEFLRGVSISIVKDVRAKRPRQTQEVYYQSGLTSSHDPAWVQRQLEVLAPKLRSQLATKVNMGQTPNIKFVPQAASQELKRTEYLWQFAKKLQDEAHMSHHHHHHNDHHHHHGATQ